MPDNFSFGDNQKIISEVWKAILNSGKLSEEDEVAQYYSIENLNKRLLDLSTIFSSYNSLHTVAIKTNPHPYILKKIAEWGYGLEAASLQEVLLAANTGIDTSKIIFNSPVKTHKELKYVSLKFPGLIVNVNGIDELDRIPAGHSLTLGLRINPMSSTETADLYNVSGEYSKFGEPIINKTKILKAVGHHNIKHLHIHSGSRTQNFKMPVNGIKKVFELAHFINQRIGKTINTINIGGGLSAGDDNKQSLAWMKEYANLIIEKCPSFIKDFRVVTEFGQWVHQHQGVTFSKVEYVKQFKKKSIAYLHVGADMFVREIYTKAGKLNFLCLDKKGDFISDHKKPYDLAGPLCFNGDYLSKNIMLPKLKEGDFIAMYPSGANTYGLWSRHCSRDIPALFTDQKDSDVLIKASESWNPFLEKSLDRDA